mmetsp:Transcript_7417/g.14895  ORF Transcript_7417/g.14895 Transcript_7417/m.14895 type:complete len:233 (-) Transcript_7417:304-1002(-)
MIILQEPPFHILHPWRQCGRKQQCLNSVSIHIGRQNCFHIFNKSHVQHLITFIEHSELQIFQVQRSTFDMVLYPSWRSNHNIKPPAQCSLLWPIWCSSIQADCVERCSLGKMLKIRRHLLRKLTCWSKNHNRWIPSVRTSALMPILGQTLNNRQDKCQRFTAPSASTPHQILSIHQRLKTLCLDRKQRFNALLAQKRLQRGTEIEVIDTQWVHCFNSGDRRIAFCLLRCLTT